MESEIINQPRVIPHRPVYQSAKRLVDLGLCLFFLPFFIPLVIICALAIMLNSGSPVFFIQERIGKGEKRFRIYKFRTMKIKYDEEESRAFMKAYVRGQIDMDKSGISTYKPVT